MNPSILALIASLKNSMQPPKQLLSWLEHQHSLTEKLKALIGEAHVKVIRQEKQRTNWFEKFFLRITEDTVIQRDVVLHARNRDCWFARSIIPDSTFTENKWFFSALASKSLGELIFTSTVVKRVFLDYYPVDRQHIEYYWPCLEAQSVNELWLRLSVFSFAEQRQFYLLEIFLPELMSFL